MKKQEMDVENVGIMQGFNDDLETLMREVLADDGMEDEDDEYETGKIMDRTPSPPEILMNTLRGDMRSVDARREELADLVGYNAAMDTPDEVLALLQGEFAAQGGIAALPSEVAPMPEMAPQGGMPGMPPQGGMPPGAPPMAQGPQGGMPPQAPLQMANGGYVQSFADGSEEDGVTPFGSESSSYYDPALRDYATQQTLQFLQ